MGRIQEMRKIGVGLTVTGLLLLFVGVTWMMSGCGTSREEKMSSQSSVTAETPEAEGGALPKPSEDVQPPKMVVPDSKDPLNNLGDCEKWGNEQDFFRGGTMEVGEIVVKDLSDSRISFDKAGGTYVMAVHCHNASGQDLKNVIMTVMYPQEMRDERDNNVATLTISGEGLAKALQGELRLQSEVPLSLSPNPDYPVMADDGNGGDIKFKASGMNLLDKSMIDISLATLPQDADYTFLIAVDAAPM